MKSLGIVGGGPRGLSALENVCEEYSKKSQILDLEIVLFEPKSTLGNSFVYDLDQPDSNWINISERAMDIPGRPKIEFNNVTVPSFPSYHDWAGLNYEIIDSETPDTFPARSKLGHYLVERFETIQQPLQNNETLTILQKRVKDLKIKEDSIHVITSDENIIRCKQIVLAIGHQSNFEDDQLIEWENELENPAQILFKKAYPIKDVTQAIQPNSNVAIRGFGLSAMDVIRAILNDLNYKFEVINEKSKEVKLVSEGEKITIFPFSLDGYPMCSKPIHAKFDDEFMLTEKNRDNLLYQLSKPWKQERGEDEFFVLNEIIPIVAETYLSLNNPVRKTSTKEEITNVLKNWVKDNKYVHPFLLDHRKNSEDIMEAFILMSIQQRPVTIDYCFGQVWRSFQPTMYEALSYSKCSEEVVAKIVAFDERIKRYSYGPPVESLQFLKCLVENDILNLNFAKDPKVVAHFNGWELIMDAKKQSIDFMINGVLDSPQLLKINTEIIINLLRDKIIQPLHSDLGLEVDDNGFVVSRNTSLKVPIAVLGRIAKGSYIGLDAILECFSDRQKIWAKEFVKRINMEGSLS